MHRFATKHTGISPKLRREKRGINPEDRLKLLNGVKMRNASRRSPGTSLKDHKFYEIYLTQHKYFYDADPPILVRRVQRQSATSCPRYLHRKRCDCSH